MIKNKKLHFVPIDVDTLQSRISKALATYLSNSGLSGQICLPTAIDIMSFFQKAINENDEKVIIREVIKSAMDYNKWVKKYHPDFEQQTVFNDKKLNKEKKWK